MGAGYFDEILMAATSGQSTTAALKGSTEEAQFVDESYNEDIVPINPGD